MTKKTKSLTAYNLYDFVKGVQDAVLEGYRLSTENANFPVQLGPSLYTGIMVLEEVTKEEPVAEVATSVAEKETEEVVEDKPKSRTKKVAKE